MQGITREGEQKRRDAIEARLAEAERLLRARCPACSEGLPIVEIGTFAEVHQNAKGSRLMCRLTREESAFFRLALEPQEPATDPLAEVPL